MGVWWRLHGLGLLLPFLRRLGPTRSKAVSPVPLNARRVAIPDSFQAIQDYCWDQGWTDGLPVVPPTEPLVREMLASYGGDPSTSLGTLQPRNSQATLTKVAINAVMAGCQPEYFPVVVAAVKAALDEDFNLAGNATTTGGAAQVLIVNGPIAKELGINGDAACFGPGSRANAAIGRALRLVIRNLAGLIPGEMDKATLATPGRYSFCFSENEERSPWEPRARLRRRLQHRDFGRNQRRLHHHGNDCSHRT